MRHAAWMRWCGVVVPIVALGCGGPTATAPPPLVSALGTVYLDDEPLTGADLLFRPTGDTQGIGGVARSDGKGNFMATYARGGPGLPPGVYRVVVSRRVMPDGTPVPANDDTPPIESPARETLPPKYSDEGMTELEIEIAAEPQPLELRLES